MKKQFKGYIQNLSDGTVEVVAEVFDDDFDTFMQILKEGSPLSAVEEVKHEIIDDAQFNTDGFEIRY
jgi:acylphosphatase